jgi:hypothetical protein
LGVGERKFVCACARGGYVHAMAVGARQKSSASTGDAPLRVSPRQVIAFRLSRLGLARPEKDLARATTPVGLPDFPPGAALSALAPRLAAACSTTLGDAFDARTLVRLRAMRGAPVVVPVGEYDVFAGGMLPPDEASMRAFIQPAMDSVNRSKLSAQDVVDLVTRHATKALTTAPLDRDQLHAHLRDTLPQQLLPYCRACDSHHVHPSLLYAVALKGRLVLFPRDDGPYRIWRFDRWIAGGKRQLKRGRLAAMNDPAVELLRRFLRAYGPATPTEFAAWAGIGGGQPRAMWSQIADQLVPVEMESSGRKAPMHFLLAEDAKELLDGDRRATEPTVRLLAPGDPLLQLRDRDTLVPDQRMQKVIWKNLSPTGVVLLGPEVAAVARLQKKKKLHVTIDAFRRFDGAARAAVEKAAERLAKLRTCSEVDVAWTFTR